MLFKNIQVIQVYVQFKLRICLWKAEPRMSCPHGFGTHKTVIIASWHRGSGRANVHHISFHLQIWALSGWWLDICKSVFWFKVAKNYCTSCSWYVPAIEETCGINSDNSRTWSWQLCRQHEMTQVCKPHTTNARTEGRHMPRTSTILIHDEADSTICWSCGSDSNCSCCCPVSQTKE